MDKSRARASRVRVTRELQGRRAFLFPILVSFEMIYCVGIFLLGSTILLSWLSCWMQLLHYMLSLRGNVATMFGKDVGNGFLLYSTASAIELQLV